MSRRHGILIIAVLWIVPCLSIVQSEQETPTTQPAATIPGIPASEGLVRCANLVYDRNKTSVCFADRFLRQMERETSIRTEGSFRQIRLEADELFRYPFAIMTGEGAFELSTAQRKNLKTFLQRGGFILASAGCSNSQWDKSFRSEIKALFSDHPLTKLPMSHPVFHTVYDIEALKIKKDAAVILEGMEINGRLALIYSEQGLNDTGNAGKGCCCCGGSEILNAQSINANILAYALTH